MKRTFVTVGSLFCLLESESVRPGSVFISGQCINYRRFIKLEIYYGICSHLFVTIHEKTLLRSPSIHQIEDRNSAEITRV